MTESEFRDLLKQNISGGFLFYGDEDYLKNHYRRELIKSALADCPPDLLDFNHIQLTLEDGDFSALTSAISTLPMFCEKKVVEVSPPNMGSWRESERKALLEALEGIADSPDTVLLLIAARGTLDPGTPQLNFFFSTKKSKFEFLGPYSKQRICLCHYFFFSVFKILFFENKNIIRQNVLKIKNRF